MDPIFKNCKSKDAAAYAAIGGLSVHIKEALSILKISFSFADRAHYKALGHLFRAEEIISQFNALHSRKEFL